MREPPPRELVERLQRLGLATPGQVGGVSGVARRLARGLPRLESVWIDALAQARVLTPFQADRLREGDGEDLRIGPCVVRCPVAAPAYLDSYRATHVSSGHDVRLTILTPPPETRDRVAMQAKQLVAATSSLAHPGLLLPGETGVAASRIWLVGPDCSGVTVADRIIGRGRFPAPAVLEIARQMADAIVALEEAGLCHGDIGARTVFVDATGVVKLLDTGLRAVAHPEEGFDFSDLLPQDYDYLAPERVLEGTPVSRSSDLYACGCLWWQMLTGRPPLTGGSSLAKLRAAASPRIEEVRFLAPDTPQPLAETIEACLAVNPAERPQSATELVSRLEAPTRNGRVLAAAACRAPAAVRSPWRRTLREAPRQLVRTPLRLGVTVAAVVATVATLWGIRQYDPSVPSPPETPHGVSTTKVAESSPPADGATGSRQESNPGLSATAGPTAVDVPAVPPSPPAPVVTRPPTPETPPRELVLEGARPLDGRRLRLVPGTRVRAAAGSRATLLASGDGIPVAVDGVRFEDIDFLWSPNAGAGSEAGYGAMLQLAAGDLGFERCTFRATTARGGAAVVRLSGATSSSRPASTGRRLEWLDSVVLSGDALAMLDGGEAASIRLSNVLYLASGPIVHLGRYPGVESPVGIQLSNVTLRDGGPVVACDVAAPPGPLGAIAVQADQCALVPRAGTPLLAFRGAAFTEDLLRGILWNGQGSLVSSHGAIVGLVGPGGSLEVVDDANVSIAGLVRGNVEFAGEASRGPDASRIERWQVPLRSASPPGVNPRRLPPFPATDGE